MKGARSVCKAWDDVGASHLGQRTILSTQLIHPYQCLDAPEEISPLLNLKLGRTIEILGDGKPWLHRIKRDQDEPKNANYSSKVSNLFFQLTSRFHNTTTNIELKNIKIGGATPLIEAFSSFQFPKLVSISLHNDQDIWFRADIEEHAVFWGNPALPLFPEMSSLATISYAIGLEVFPYRPWLQACINSTPNLQRLTIIDNFHPNLASCGKTLKSLEYDGWPRKQTSNRRFPVIDEAFNLDGVVRMVAQVSDSIETLRLGFSIPDIYSRDRCLDVS